MDSRSLGLDSGGMDVAVGKPDVEGCSGMVIVYVMAFFGGLLWE